MASWGLLAGFGRGLSQGSEHLSRGLAEDREAERQRMREESIEKRWKRQESREDSRNKVADERYADQVISQETAQTQAQKNADRSYGLQERQLNETTAMRKTQQIEANFSGLLESSDKSEAKITDKYVRMMGKEGLTAAEYEKLNTDMKNEITENRNYYSQKINDFTQSYGDKLKGTAFEYLLHVKPAADPSTTTGDTDPAASQISVVDNTAADRLAKIQDYLKSTTSGQALSQIATDYQNRFAQPTVGQKAVDSGLLKVPVINEGLSVDDIGQFATFATSPGLTPAIAPVQQPGLLQYAARTGVKK
ncbi:MAG: hypothetical protein U5L02_06495 [Rheinheimera sp.]|nr:hypothetical protein [Rheinheimera sp.]